MSFKDQVTDAVRAVAAERGLSEGDAVFVEAAGRGALRETFPYVAEWLTALRRHDSEGTLSPDLAVVLDADLPGWRTLRPRELDRQWAKAAGAPVPRARRRAKHYRRADTSHAPHAPEVAAETTPTPPSDVVFIDPASRAMASKWRRLIRAAQEARLAAFPGTVAKGRVSANSGTMEPIAMAAMEQVAPGWRTRSVMDLDAERRRSLDALSAGEATRTVMGDEGRIASGPARGPRPVAAAHAATPTAKASPPARASASTAPRPQSAPSSSLDIAALLRAAEQGAILASPAAARQLSAVQAAPARVPASLLARLDQEAPGWRVLPARRLDDGWHLRQRLPAPSWKTNWIDLAERRALGTSYQAAYAWLRTLRRDADAGQLAPGVTEVLDSVAPGWRTLAPGAIDLRSNGRPPRAAAPSPQTAPKPLTADDEAYLAAATRGALMQQPKALAWVRSLRMRETVGTLRADDLGRLDKGMPNWRTLTPRQLDAAHVSLPDTPVPALPAPRHQRQIQAFSLLAAAGIANEVPAAVDWLAVVRHQDAQGRLAASDRAAMDAALPRWRTGSLDAPSASSDEVAPSAPARRAPASTTRRTAAPSPAVRGASAQVSAVGRGRPVFDQLDDRDGEMLALARAAQLVTAGVTANNWLVRQRKREAAGRLGAVVLEAMERDTPGWRTLGPAALDRGKRARS